MTLTKHSTTQIHGVPETLSVDFSFVISSIIGSSCRLIAATITTLTARFGQIYFVYCSAFPPAHTAAFLRVLIADPLSKHVTKITS